jgi:hypothetical protein
MEETSCLNMRYQVDSCKVKDVYVLLSLVFSASLKDKAFYNTSIDYISVKNILCHHHDGAFFCLSYLRSYGD